MNTLKNKFLLLVSFVAACLFFSCQKDIDYVQIDNQGPDLVTKVNSSVSGFVVDENNAAVLGADVTMGGSHTTTDKYGFFEIKNVMVVKNAAVVTVSKPNYFKGIKTYIGNNNNAAFFRIKLIPKTNAGSINASSGGNVTLSNGMIVALPANGVVVASGSTAYTGTVNVAAHWIDPTSADLNQTMPGDLRGIGTDGGLKLLTTYGMAAVELTGSGGELLQIAPGKKATLTMAIPASIMATAPSSIPLWSFDESVGLWKQEGTATKTGNTYVGEVSHFSFWNCDVPNTYVYFDCVITDATGHPLPNILVRITEVGSPMAGYGYTTGDGHVGGAVPDNAQLVLDVFSSYACSTPAYSQNFTTTNTNVSLGTIAINTSTLEASIEGSITDCNNNPVSNGRAILFANQQYYTSGISSTGHFGFYLLLCNSTTANVTVIGEDFTGSQQSAPVTQAITPGTNSVGNLQACGTSLQQFITYSINGGTPVTFAPPDSLYHSGNGTSVTSYIGANNYTNNTYVNFAYANSGIAVGNTQPLAGFNSSQLAQGSVNNAAGVLITEYGAVGEFIAGHFTNVIITTTTTPQINTIECSFRVRRSW